MQNPSINPNHRALRVLESLRIKYSKIEQIIHEDSLSSLVFRYWLLDGRSRILKLSYNADRWRRETYYLSFLRDLIPMPEIVDILAPQKQFSGAIVMEEVKGHLLNAVSLTNDLSFKMGEILAKLHMLKVHSYGDISQQGVKLTGKNTPRKEMEKYFKQSLEECQQIVSPSLLDQCSKFVTTHLDLLIGADGPCIVHRDYRPGNVIAHEGEIQAVIDFENTKGSFAEEDFMQMDMLVWSEYPQTRSAFVKGYATIRPLPHLEELLPLLRVLKAVGAIGFTYERGSWQSRHKHVYAKNLTFLEGFFR